MDRRDFLQVIGTAVGGAVLAKYLPPIPAAQAATAGGFLVPDEFLRVLWIDVHTEMLDVTMHGGPPEYLPGLRRWHGEAELDARALDRPDVRNWLHGQRPVAVRAERGGRRIEGEAIVTAFRPDPAAPARPRVVRVEFEGSGALTATIR
jgi:hypothetical protein